MTTKSKFIDPIPDHNYYLAQLLVQIMNFRELGYEGNLHIPLIYFGEKPSPIAQRLIDSKELACHFHPYKDDRTIRNYTASMKPWMIGKYFEQFPEEAQEVYMLLDPDVVFPKVFDFRPFLNIKHKMFGSDTQSYTGERYIREKGEGLWKEIFEIAGVDRLLLDGKSGWEVGAQYLFQGMKANFWMEVYEKSSAVYQHMVDTKDKYKPEGHEFPVQAWCAEMYVIQWLAVKYGYKPETSKLMDFTWATHSSKDWFKKPFFHNAGLPAPNGKDYCKITYQSSPFRKEIVVSPESASWYYLQLVKRTEVEFASLIWD